MIKDIAAQIRQKISGHTPQTAIILGSGLGSLGDAVCNPVYLEYKDIAGFPQSTVSGHQGRLIAGCLEGTEVLCLQGRFHLYEGHRPQVINTVVKTLQELGIQRLIVTNAAGSLTPDFQPGTIMLIKDHINLSGTNPLIGPNDDSYGPRFPDMSNAYTAALRATMKKIAQEQKIPLAEGVYMMVTGPNFETAAEIRAFRILGADAIGMSTVPEVICAAHSGMEVLGLSVLTNMGTGLRTGSQSHAETLAQGEKASADLQKLVKAFLKQEK